MEVAEGFAAVMDYAVSQGAENIGDVEGCWESQVDAQWWIALNGHDKPTKNTRDLSVESFHCYIEFNGWPAGHISPFGGWIAAGEAANEDTFIDALKAATVKT